MAGRDRGDGRAVVGDASVGPARATGRGVPARAGRGVPAARGGGALSAGDARRSPRRGGVSVAAGALTRGRVERVTVPAERPQDALGACVAAQLRPGGGCVAVICNTVAAAQRTFVAVRERVGGSVPVVLLTSRMRFVERDRVERRVLGWFGPPGGDVDRPQRAVVVATQVIEQSLDLDFDLVISELAPVDLLVQRRGGCTVTTAAGGPRRCRGRAWPWSRDRTAGTGHRCWTAVRCSSTARNCCCAPAWRCRACRRCVSPRISTRSSAPSTTRPSLP